MSGKNQKKLTESPTRVVNREDEKMKTDLEIVQDVLSGQRSSFSELVRKYQRGLLRLSLRFVKDLEIAEDVVQESFLKVYQKLHTFEGRSSFKSWIYQVTVNTAKNRLRRVQYNNLSLHDVKLAVGAEAENQVSHSDVKDILRTQIDELPFKQKTALMLRIFEDMSFKEIAEVMECPYDTAKANYRHGLLKLRHKFESNQELKKWALQDSSRRVEFRGYRLEADG